MKAAEAETKPKRKMGRKKVCPETLRQTGTQRKETFGKRTRGLFKKAHELASMCGCPINLSVGSEDGRVFHMHRVRNPCLDHLMPGAHRPHVVSTCTSQCSVGSAGEAMDLLNQLPPSSFLLDADVLAAGSVFGNDASRGPNTPLPPAFIAPSIWFYNYKTEKMEYSGFDMSGMTPMEAPFALLCAPSSCNCADCLSGRSRFVGRISPPIDCPVVAEDKSTAQAALLNPLTPSLEDDDDDDRLAVHQQVFAHVGHLDGFANPPLVNDFDSLDYQTTPEESLTVPSSGRSSTDSSPEAKNPMYEIQTIYRYGGGEQYAHAGVRVKEEPVDEMFFNEDQLLLSTFDAWFEQDSIKCGNST